MENTVRYDVSMPYAGPTGGPSGHPSFRAVAICTAIIAAIGVGILATLVGIGTAPVSIPVIATLVVGGGLIIGGVALAILFHKMKVSNKRQENDGNPRYEHEAYEFMQKNPKKGGVYFGSVTSQHHEHNVLYRDKEDGSLRVIKSTTKNDLRIAILRHDYSIDVGDIQN